MVRVASYRLLIMDKEKIADMLWDDMPKCKKKPYKVNFDKCSEEQMLLFTSLLYWFLLTDEEKYERTRFLFDTP